jgi:hypothetical protein
MAKEYLKIKEAKHIALVIYFHVTVHITHTHQYTQCTLPHNSTHNNPTVHITTHQYAKHTTVHTTEQ